MPLGPIHGIMDVASVFCISVCLYIYKFIQA
jgi:hypothetical protein